MSESSPARKTQSNRPVANETHQKTEQQMNERADKSAGERMIEYFSHMNV